ncbi:hypothetical protein O7A05_15495 [Mesorhizobium sp. Cs1330R2N1]|uniref:Phage tail tape measure protein n=1 Tax=Mesorhizobium argentiipisi TaxID=3015175 RepID=A0ABU8KDN4_9HYPH
MGTFSKQVQKTANEAAAGGKKIGGSFGQAGQDIVKGLGYTTQVFKDLNIEVTRFGDNSKASGDKAKSGAAKMKTGFDDLGISVKNADGSLKTNEQLLVEVATAFQRLPDGAFKSSVALKLFGEAGAKLIPLLDQGAAGIEEFKARAAELGIVFTDDQIKAAAKFNDALNELQKAIGGVLRGIGLIFVPAFTTGANAFRDLILRNRAAVLDFANNALARAKVLVADFFAALSGRDSDVTSNRWILTLRDGIVGFGEDVSRVITGLVIPAFEKIRAGADLAAKAINALSGAGLTGGELLVTFAIARAAGAIQLIIQAGAVAIKSLSALSTFLLANPWVAALTAVAAGITIWVTRTDAATAALQRHEGLVEGVAGAYAKASNNVKNMTDEIRNGLIIQQRAALQDLVPAFEAELKRLRDLAAAPAKENPFSQALRDFAAGGSLDAYLKAVKEIGAANPELNAAADAFVHLTDKATELQTKIKPSADFLDLLTHKITDAQFQARQAGAGFQALGTDAAAGLDKTGAAADGADTKVKNLDHTIQVFRGGGAGGSISKETFDVVDGVARRADQSKAALDGVATSAQAAGDHVRTVAQEVANSVKAVPDAIKPDAASRAVDSVVSDVQKIKPAADEAATGLKAALNPDDGVGGGLNSAVETAVDGVITDVQKMPDAASEAVGGLNSALSDIDTSGAEQAATNLAQPFQALPGVFSGIFSGLSALVQGGFGNLSSVISSLAAQIRTEIASIISALQAAVAQAQQLRAQASGSSDSGGGHGGFAGGGYVRGAGGPKSDSILAWLSNGEYIMTAEAVQRIGVDALNAWNYGRDILSGLRGFRMGGVVDNVSRSLAIPRFAGGGLAVAAASSPQQENTSGKTVLVKMDFGLGPRDVIDLIAPDYVAYQLQKVSLKAARASAGRSPRRGT